MTIGDAGRTAPRVRSSASSRRIQSGFPKKILAREDLGLLVWGYDRTIDSYQSFARKGEENPRIRRWLTVWELGTSSATNSKTFLSYLTLRWRGMNPTNGTWWIFQVYLQTTTIESDTARGNDLGFEILNASLERRAFEGAVGRTWAVTTAVGGISDFLIKASRWLNVANRKAMVRASLTSPHSPQTHCLELYESVKLFVANSSNL